MKKIIYYLLTLILFSMIVVSEHKKAWAAHKNTFLDADNITSGTLGSARLDHSSVAFKNEVISTVYSTFTSNYNAITSTAISLSDFKTVAYATFTSGAVWAGSTFTTVNTTNLIFNSGGITFSDGTKLSSNTNPSSTANDRWVNSNYLMNAEFAVNQREFAGGAISAGVYGHDRWKANVDSNYTVSGSTIFLVSGELQQIIESPHLDSRSVVFSVEDASATLTVHVTGSGDAQTITAGSGRKSANFVISSTATGNITVTLIGTNVSFKRPQLEIGTFYSQFQHVPYSQELLRCQRYYEKLTNTTAVYAPLMSAWVNSINSAQACAFYKVRKRATPTVASSAYTTFGPEGFTGTLTGISIPGSDKIDVDACGIVFSLNGDGAASGGVIRANNQSAGGAYVTFDSEL